MSTAPASPLPAPSTAGFAPPPRVFWTLCIGVVAMHVLVLWALQDGLAFIPPAPRRALEFIQVLPPRPLTMKPAAPTPPPAAAPRPMRPRPVARAIAHPHPRPLQHNTLITPRLPHKPSLPQREPVAPQPSTAPSNIMQAPERTSSNPATASSQPLNAAAQAVAPPTAPTQTDAAAKPAPSTPPAFGAAYLHNPVPEYPPLARRMGEEGTVKLRVMVSASGHVDTIRIQQSSGYATLDKSAVKAVQQWTFTPGQAAGKPVPGWVIVPIRFSLAS